MNSHLDRLPVLLARLEGPRPGRGERRVAERGMSLDTLDDLRSCHPALRIDQERQKNGSFAPAGEARVDRLPLLARRLALPVSGGSVYALIA